MLTRYGSGFPVVCHGNPGQALLSFMPTRGGAWNSCCMSQFHRQAVLHYVAQKSCWAATWQATLCSSFPTPSFLSSPRPLSPLMRWRGGWFGGAGAEAVRRVFWATAFLTVLLVLRPPFSFCLLVPAGGGGGARGAGEGTVRRIHVTVPGSPVACRSFPASTLTSPRSRRIAFGS